MRTPCLCLCLLLPLAADAPLRVAAVERAGSPPFEDDRRIYQLEGEEAPRLRPGESLQLVRPGDARNPGRLKVASVEGGRASAFLEARGSTYPLIGDLAVSRRLAAVPVLPVQANLPDLGLRPPQAVPPPESPRNLVPAAPLAGPPAEPQKQVTLPVPPPPVESPRETPLKSRREAIYFLEGDGSLSPKGRDKVQAAVRTWGAEGRWRLALPVNRLLPEKVRLSRIQGLRKALEAAGIRRVDLKDVERHDRDTGDVVYLEKD